MDPNQTPGSGAPTDPTQPTQSDPNAVGGDTGTPAPDMGTTSETPTPDMGTPETGGDTTQTPSTDGTGGDSGATGENPGGAPAM